MSKFKFSEDAVKGDLATLLPPKPPRAAPSRAVSTPNDVQPSEGHSDALPEPSATVSADVASGPAQAQAPVIAEPQEQTRAAAPATPAKPSTSAAAETRAASETRPAAKGTAAPRVKVDGDLFRWVGELQHRDLADTGKKRSHGRIALEMVQKYREQLSKRWETLAEPSGDELFPGLEEVNSGRKAVSDTSKDLYLSGPKPEHIAKLDDLVAQWKFGSRRELINEALRLGFEADDQKSSGKRRAR